jgi:biotin carboxyl carrier protein
MRYLVTIDGTERAIDVQITDAGTVDVSVDGAKVDADAVRIPGGVSLRIDGRVFDLVVGGSAENKQVAAGSRRTIAAVESERARARRARRGGAGAGEKEIRSPMPGRVVKILVAEGDEVEAEQPVIVVEAMKMENELRATAAGKVKTIEVTEGQAVEGEVVLVRFE